VSDDLAVLKEMLDENLTVRDPKGREVLQVALIATVYFREAYRREVREAVVACCEDFFQRCGHKLRWALHPDSRYMEPYGDGKGSHPRTWLPDLGEEGSFSLIYHGARHERGAGCPSLNGLGRELLLPRVKLGHLQFGFPLLWFSQNPGTFPEVVLEICRKLQPDSGYGGIGVIESPDNGISHRWEPVIYELAQRFPGLEADFPIDHGLWLVQGRDDGRSGIKGVNWLTVVADRYLDELGGAARVEADVRALDSRFIVHGWGGGLMIQAGERPELGDAERDRWPELYVKLAKYLKPLRITQHRPFGHAGPGPRFGNDSKEALAWLRRFDDR
jgi:hypothetical protein